MQLLALTRQNPAGAHGVQRQVELHNPVQHMMPVHPQLHAETGAVAPRGKNAVLAHDDCEGVSLLDTPAPRKRPPVPTKYEAEPATATYQPNGSSHQGKPGKLPSAQPGVQIDMLIALYCLWFVDSVARACVIIIDILLCHAAAATNLIGFVWCKCCVSFLFIALHSFTLSDIFHSHVREFC